MPAFRGNFWELASEGSLHCRDNCNLNFVKSLRKPSQIQAVEYEDMIDETSAYLKDTWEVGSFSREKETFGKRKKTFSGFSSSLEGGIQVTKRPLLFQT